MCSFICLTWNVPLEACMYKIPVDASERGSQWPEQWSARAEKVLYWLKSSQTALKEYYLLQRVAYIWWRWSHDEGLMSLKFHLGGTPHRSSQYHNKAVLIKLSLINIGTGYFVEKTMAEGKEYCECKMNLMKSNYDQLIEVASKKKNIADEVGAFLQAKLRQAAPTT
ncbi:hypothetical protein IFM89_011127 [Coptis chinensis]|uniref:Uncharacterized protein n=1 Tax=Coptis chinensis TaxID=261450 RepID=A0A835HPB4_9MAGN|nr:hypothetical protein IFM89_011127 [Coptis chinensis]